MNSHCVNPRDTSKPPKYLVIFFHGYGSSGSAMAGHAGGLLSPLLPDAKLVFPDGPIELAKDSEGHSYHSWFNIDDILENPDQDIVSSRADASAAAINQYIDDLIKKEGIDEKNVILAGFSQGATMAYYAGLLRATEVGGIFSLSGGALVRLQTPRSKPPVGVVAGEQEGGTYSGAPQARQAHTLLDQNGFYTDCVVIPGQGHDISWKSMELLAVFTRAVTAEDFRNRVARERKTAPPKQKLPAPR